MCLNFANSSNFNETMNYLFSVYKKKYVKLIAWLAKNNKNNKLSFVLD